ncbi:hypothetical protein EXU57_06440 [Segetibacter sp. 3557_3]|uniref:hypothetical protein n=1 Tax=Segetibacter sp. 3557_3 TaxID=2547429 RepID=UPI001058F18D|nr:hypothetical protein [Segetibacter sp. 3557_3]TDH28093.1 hypothetical protein EXU57_06440 [Segetibacter sp. 3557_3]
MTDAKLKISEENLDQLVAFLIQEWSFDFEKHSTDASILISENFYFRNMSTQMNIVILKKENNSILIDIVAGGGAGIFHVDLNSAKAFVDGMSKLVMKYAKEYGLNVRKITPA